MSTMGLTTKLGLKGCGCAIAGAALIAGCAGYATYKHHERVRNAIQTAKELKDYAFDRKLPAPEPDWRDYYSGFPQPMKNVYSLYDAETIGKALRALDTKQRERLLDFIVPKTSPHREYFRNYPYGDDD